ncbi:rCG28489 [Rattus norvegicus]|uniref:RCG28489 n=1 Tax=Rattus norvegicus TaxID=10116 RepID=A6HV89_RAT|nr:rCG28489 [Rattus norvegicus]
MEACSGFPQLLRSCISTVRRIQIESQSSKRLSNCLTIPAGRSREAERLISAYPGYLGTRPSCPATSCKP